MKRLRAQIAVLLVGAVMFVVSIASLVIWLVVDPPRIERHANAIAAQIVAVAALVERLPPAERNDLPFGLAFHTEPAPGPVLDSPTAAVRVALAKLNRPLAIHISRPSPDRTPVASIPLPPQGWFLMPIAIDPPPPRGWLILSSWLVLVAIGTTLVSVLLVHRLTRPLALLEQAVESIRPDGTLPHLPEHGPAVVQATARTINLLSSRLQSAMQSRMRLVAAAGHDLRTPMTRMRLRAEFFEDNEERTRWLADLDELDRIADSAIGLVREQADEVPQEEVRLDELVQACAKELAELGLDVIVTETVPVVVRVGPLAFRRALRNLMTNAATHGHRARAMLKRDGNDAVIIIEDNGPGIPEALIEQVFEPFFRVDPARRQHHGGAGLGLAIAREIIERAGGRTQLTNRVEGGLRQEIRLSC